MKWYKKQLQSLEKKASDGGPSYAALHGDKKSPAARSHNPVAQRNRNRNKTDSKPTGK